MISELIPELNSVKKPASYLPLELNLNPVPFNSREVRFVLTYPDLYEVGSSHIGGKILYHVINSSGFALMHRAYLPRPDMQELIKRKGIPLYTLEELRPVKDYHLWGISLSSELTYTNILPLFELAGVPFTWEERLKDEKSPLIFAGGPCVYNPTPLSKFFDFFSIGDGEETLLEVAKLYRLFLKEGGKKEDFLSEIRKIDGIWVPKFGRYKVKRAVFCGVSKGYFPTSFPVPSVETAQDRIAVEAARGCLRGCRFCQAGYIYRPYRERDVKSIRSLIEKTFKETGYEEASLSSLSISDHSKFNQLIPSVMELCYENIISLSLPSMRVKGFNPELASQVMQVKKTGFTLAPEAGSDRLRKIINKELTNEDLFKAVDGLFSRGWSRLKLYFMIGLPFEREEDVEAIADMLWQIHKIGRKYRGKKQLAAGISIFVPKPFTPFQWEAYSEREEAEEKIALLKRKSPKRFTLRFHDYRQSLIESLFTRGDEELSELLLECFKEGCQLDGWDEYFNWEGWQKALEKSGVNAKKYLGKRELDEELPWDFIGGVVSKSFLIRELEKARREAWTPDCRIVGCHACGVCTPAQIRSLKDYPIPEKIDFKAPPRPKREFPLRGKVAFFFEKKGFSRFLSLLDLNRVFTRTFRKFSLPLRYSQGFNPHPRFSVLFGLPVGVCGEGEIVEVELTSLSFDFEKFLRESDKFLPQGLKLTGYTILENPKESLSERIDSLTYLVKPLSGGLNVKNLQKRTFIDSKGRERNLEEELLSFEELEDGKLLVKLKVNEGRALGIQELLKLLQADLTSAEVVRKPLLEKV